MTDKTTITATGAYARAAALGAVAGLRSMMPLALLAATANRPGDTPSGSRAPGLPPLLRSRGALIGFGLAAGGELVGDKLPQTPSRLAAGPLGARLFLGATAGALVCRAGGQSPLPGAVLGAVAAGAFAFAGYHLRAAAGRATPIPDPAWGAVEDAIALGLGARALSGLRAED